jgi:ubiquinone/menaquinone biosynthesis C-methylase UbiE
MEARLQRRVQRYGWDRAVADYEPGWRSQLAPAQSAMLDMAAPAPGEMVLDVACGTGLVSFRAAALVGPEGAVIGSDISEGMVEAAKRQAQERGTSNVRFERYDAEDLPLGDATFDLVLCALGLMYVPNPGKALREMRRLLKPGGRVAAAVWGERKNCGWAEIFPITDARVVSEVCPLFFGLGARNMLAASLEAAGFRDVRQQRLSSVLHYSSAEEALTAAFRGGPVALAYGRFDDATKAAVHAEYLDSISAFRTDDGYRIPGEFVVAAARVPP